MHKVSLLFVACTLTSQLARAELPASSTTSAKAIREAENLSLLKDRLPACTVLVRTMHKAERSDTLKLRAKLNQLSTYFYTDHGFQAYLVGKELFAKQRFSDALDKLLEADEVENGNILVLHILTLTQLWMKKEALALATVNRALQINPYDLDLLKDQVAVEASKQDWAEVLSTARALSSGADLGAEILQNFGEALMESGNLEKGLLTLKEAHEKDENLPEPYYWLGAGGEEKEGVPFLTKYLALCKGKVPHFFTRDPRGCIHIALAEQKLASLTGAYRSEENQVRKIRALFMLALLFASASVLDCGVKGDPVPPATPAEFGRNARPKPSPTPLSEDETN